MAGRQQIATESSRVVPENTELDFAIAEDVWVWCTPGLVFVEEILEDAVPILPGEIDMVQRNFDVFADLAGVLQVFGRRTIAIVVFPVGHVQSLHVGTSLLQQAGGDGGIYATRETKDDALAIEIFSECGHGRAFYHRFGRTCGAVQGPGESPSNQ